MWLLEKEYAQSFLPKFKAGDKSIMYTQEDRQALAAMQRQQTLAAEEFDGARVNGTAIVPIVGVLGNGSWFFATTYHGIIENIHAAEQDPTIDRILLSINSPGGMQDGLVPAMMAIKNAKKPVDALVTESAASAAYMLASQANKIYGLHALSRVGSVGVVVEVIDDTEAMEKEGIKLLTFTNTQSPYKRVDLTTEAGAKVLQEQIDAAYLELESMIAAGRNTTPEKVRENYGNGKMFLAKQAILSTMIDNIFSKEYFVENDFTKTPVEFNAMTDNAMNKFASSEELKGAYPQFCASIAEQAVCAERERVAGWMAFVDVDAEVVAAGIKEGKALDVGTAAKLAARQATTVKVIASENIEDIALPEKAAVSEQKAEVTDKVSSIVAAAKQYMDNVEGK